MMAAWIAYMDMQNNTPAQNLAIAVLFFFVAGLLTLLVWALSPEDEERS